MQIDLIRMAKNLVIVESPAKAKTIEKFLGSDYIVKSSFGHIRDLDKGDSAIDVENNFKPNYIISPDKAKVVSELKKLAKESEMVWLASDEDREGEAISWHLFEVLGLKETNTKRIVFHEITKPAIENAILNPRKIDKDLVDAQQARRVLDRLVGFELSPVLWRKVKPSLSAGRVQSVAVKLVVEREREINNFNSHSNFRISAIFKPESGKKTVKAELNKRFEKEEDALKLLQLSANTNFLVDNIEVKPSQRKPAAPFTTSTLQQEASRKLGYPVAKTMLLAQKLYEAGHITYMRTDSVNLSKLAIAAAATEIKRNYGDKYSHPRVYTTKSASAQEAHEAIRPTYFENSNPSSDAQENKLYDLIWKRTVASQMADAEIERTIVDIKTPSYQEMFRAEGEVIKFDGFLKVYLESNDDDDDDENKNLLPPLKVNESLELEEMISEEKYTRPAPRYTEASLVKKLEELGIGRPSTYAPTISTVQKRGYVIKETRDGFKRNVRNAKLKGGVISQKTESENFGAEKSKLFPTDIGTVVTDFLNEHFKQIMDYNFTAKVEKEFDDIAQGMISWTKMIDTFYKPFHKEVDITLANADRAKGEKLLGTDPNTGKPMSVRVGRFGPLVQIGDNDDEEKKYAQRARLLAKGDSYYLLVGAFAVAHTIFMDVAHDAMQATIHLFAIPRQAQGVLAHFKTRNRHTAGVTGLAWSVQDTGCDKRMRGIQRCRHVRAFGDALNTIFNQHFCVFEIELVLRRARQRDIDRHMPGTLAGFEFQLESRGKRLKAAAFNVFQVHQRSKLGLVKTSLIDNGARRVRDRHDFGAKRHGFFDRVLSDVTATRD